MFCVIFASIFLNFAVFHIDTSFAKCKDIEISSAKAMTVMDVETGRVLYSKNNDKKLPMASTTKIITAIVAIEKNPDLGAVVTIGKDCVGVEGTSIYLKEGETLTLEELLFGLMLRSGNDAAEAIAIHTSGSVEKFVEQCNLFVQKLGAKNTHLENPHGLPDDNHYTTAFDLALISAYALKNEKFAEIVSTTEKKIESVLNGASNRKLQNKNKLLKNMPEATGVKTGYTKKAGRCFVGSAKKNNMHLVCVVLDCAKMFEECQLLLEKGFSEYHLTEILAPENILGDIEIVGGEKQKTKFCVRDGISLPLKISEVDEVEVVYMIPESVVAPHQASKPIGEIQIYVSKDLIFSDKVYIIEDVKSREVNILEKLVHDMIHLG